MQTFTGNDVIGPVPQLRITAGQSKQEEGKPIKNEFLSFLLFFGIATVLLAAGFVSHSTALMVFGGLLLITMILGLVQTLIKRKVARMMHTKVNDASSLSLKAQNTDAEPQTKKAPVIPLFKLEVYEQNELPDHGYTLNTHLTGERNIFNIAPMAIFYFFNFFSSTSLINKTSSGFQRHGPLFYLGSPQDIGFHKLWNALSISKIMRKLLLTTPEQLEEAIGKASSAPLPPKTKGLLAEDYLMGAYPSNVFYCTDVIWQQCVSILFRKTAFAIIDACDYTKERAGLQWEIGQIINHIATERFIVFINSKTDLSALGESFRNCWMQMSAESPNNRDNPLPVRFIFNQWPDHRRDDNFHRNIFLAQYHEQALSNDNVTSMLLNTVPKEMLGNILPVTNKRNGEN